MLARDGYGFVFVVTPTPHQIHADLGDRSQHLCALRDLLENDDFSYRRLFLPAEGQTLEREIQLWVAASLRDRLRRYCSVVRENAVDQDKEVDITVGADGVGQVPIEVKPLPGYSAKALEGTLEHQLLGQYMQPREREYGVLLLVRRSQETWQTPEGDVDFAGLCAHLQRKADALGAQHGKVLRVLSIDLRAPTAPARSPASPLPAPAPGPRAAAPPSP